MVGVDPQLLGCTLRYKSGVKMKLLMVIGAMAALLGPTAANATVVATCGASVGKSFYLSSGSEGGWTDDRIAKGQTIFSVDEDGEWDVIFRDSTGKTVSATTDGGAVIKVKGDAPFKTLMLLVAYPARGVVETYSLAKEPAEGGRVLMYTANQAQFRGAVPPKISGIISACD